MTCQKQFSNLLIEHPELKELGVTPQIAAELEKIATSQCQLNVPFIGEQLQVARDWHFSLSYNRQNEALLKIVAPDDLATKIQELGYEKLFYTSIAAPFPFVLPAGTILTVVNVYIQQLTGNYDTIRFKIEACPDSRLRNKSFVVKMSQANQLIYHGFVGKKEKEKKTPKKLPFYLCGDMGLEDFYSSNYVNHFRDDHLMLMKIFRRHFPQKKTLLRPLTLQEIHQLKPGEQKEVMVIYRPDTSLFQTPNPKQTVLSVLIEENQRIGNNQQITFSFPQKMPSEWLRKAQNNPAGKFTYSINSEFFTYSDRIIENASQESFFEIDRFCFLTPSDEEWEKRYQQKLPSL